LSFTNAADKKNMNVFTSGDTMFFKAKSDTTIVAIGSGTWFISGTSQWTSSCVATGDYCMAVGFEDTVSGDNSVVFGYRNNVSGNGSLSFGGIGNDNSSNYSGIIGGEGNTVSGNSSVIVVGQNGIVTAENSAILGSINGILTSANSVMVCAYSDSVGASDGGSRFFSGADSNYFEGSTFFGGGVGIKKIVTVGSHLAIILSSDDTLWAASDTTGF
jgi:hypothetical protein